jgi:hypothetical protein
MTRRRSFVAGAAVALGVAIVVGLLLLRSSASPVDPGGARAALVASVEAETTEGFYRPYETLAAMLPNTKHQFPGHETPASVFTSVVVGDIIGVTDGVGFIEGVPGVVTRPGQPQATSFDSPLAAWRTLKLTVKVTRAIAGHTMGQVVLDWPIMGSNLHGEDARMVSEGLRRLGPVVLFLGDVPANPTLAGLRMLDRVYGVATVAPDGRLGFPFADAATVAQFTDGITTVDDLAAAARRPEAVESS